MNSSLSHSQMKSKGLTNQCAACGTSLAAAHEHLWGRMKCPRCGADLWFLQDSNVSYFVVRNPRHPVANILDNPSAGLDSLDAVELIMGIEEELNLEIPDDDVQDLQSLADVFRYLISSVPPR